MFRSIAKLFRALGNDQSVSPCRVVEYSRVFAFCFPLRNFTYCSHSFMGRRCRSFRACVSSERYSARPTIRRSKQIKKSILSKLNFVFGYNFWPFGFISIFVSFAYRRLVIRWTLDDNNNSAVSPYGANYWHCLGLVMWNCLTRGNAKQVLNLKLVCATQLRECLHISIFIRNRRS